MAQASDWRYRGHTDFCFRVMASWTRAGSQSRRCADRRQDRQAEHV